MRANIWKYAGAEGLEKSETFHNGARGRLLQPEWPRRRARCEVLAGFARAEIGTRLRDWSTRQLRSATF